MKVFLFNLKKVLVSLVLMTAIASTACAPSSSPIAMPTGTDMPTETTNPTMTPTVTATITRTATAKPTLEPTAALTMTADPTKGGIEGRLYRSDTDESIANASVTLNDATKEVEDPERTVAETTTDQEGRYSFVNIEPGRYTLSVSFIFQNASDSPCKSTTKRDAQGNVVSIGFPIYHRENMLLGASAVDQDDGSLELNVFTMLESEVAAGDLVKVDIDLNCQ